MVRKDSSTSVSRLANSNKLQNARRIQAMRKAFNLVRNRQKANAHRIPDLEKRKRRLKQARKYAVGNESIIKQAVENLRQNGIRVCSAVSREEAISLVIKEIGDNKLVVKSKSNLTKEIGLTAALERKGIEVVETDIGDRIIQLAGDEPTHPTGPASHLTKHDIAKMLSAYYRLKVQPNAKYIVDFLRTRISADIARSKVGITGANAIAAEEGAILLLHNEGNIIEVAMRPEKHIILAGIDKIYQNLEEAMNMLKIQAFCTTGSLKTSFVNIVSGPSQTADIEKQLIAGVHGPAELCVILVDNHRHDIAISEYRDLLHCIGCGQCLLVCPAYGVHSSRFTADSNLGGRGLVYSALSGGVPINKRSGLDLCLSCRKCRHNCPVDIDIPSMIVKLRLKKYKRREAHIQTAYDFLRAHIEWIGSAAGLEMLLLALKFSAKQDSD
ncbi:MAG TPA: LUD domain-containing protein [Dehalococcoidia bacterium]|jgi:L-lactate dehydrogenase complex protein LldG